MGTEFVLIFIGLVCLLLFGLFVLSKILRPKTENHSLRVFESGATNIGSGRKNQIIPNLERANIGLVIIVWVIFLIPWLYSFLEGNYDIGMISVAIMICTAIASFIMLFSVGFLHEDDK